MKPIGARGKSAENQAWLTGPCGKIKLGSAVGWPHQHPHLSILFQSEQPFAAVNELVSAIPIESGDPNSKPPQRTAGHPDGTIASDEVVTMVFRETT
jgi:hypothetical protein